MFKVILILAALVILGEAHHRYDARKYELVQTAGEKAEKIVEDIKIESKDEKFYLNNQASDYLYNIGEAIYFLNRAIYRESEHLGDTSHKKLAEVTKEIGVSACSLLDALNSVDTAAIKTKLKVCVELSKNKVKDLSLIASEADTTQGGRTAEYLIAHATRSIQRGFYQIVSRHVFLGKTREDVRTHINETRTKATVEIEKLSDEGKEVEEALLNPTLNLAELVQNVIKKVNSLLFAEEGTPNEAAIKKLHQKLLVHYGEIIDLRVDFGKARSGTDLKNTLLRLSDNTAELFKELADLATDATGKRIIEDVLPLTETGVQFFFFYIKTSKPKST